MDGQDEKEELFRVIDESAGKLLEWGVKVLILTYDSDPINQESEVRYYAKGLSGIETRGLLDYAKNEEWAKRLNS